MSRVLKDKNRPKGPMSAYACFVQVIREEHKKKHPGEHIVFSDFSKKCAERWKVRSIYFCVDSCYPLGYDTQRKEAF